MSLVALGVEQTGQLVKVAIKLLNLLHKLTWYSVGLLQLVADMELLGLGHITPENHEQVKGYAVHKGKPRPLLLFSVLDS